jgi:hypothetical protein
VVRVEEVGYKGKALFLKNIYENQKLKIGVENVSFSNGDR